MGYDTAGLGAAMAVEGVRGRDEGARGIGAGYEGRGRRGTVRITGARHGEEGHAGRRGDIGDALHESEFL